MSASEYVFDPVDYARVSAMDNATAHAGMQVRCGPTTGGASVGAPSLRLNMGGGNPMSKSTIRSLAYFMIVGGVIVWVVGHLAPIRA